MPLCWRAIRLRFRAGCNLLGVCSRSILLLADLHGGHSRHRDWLQFDGVARLPPRPPVLRFLLHIVAYVIQRAWIHLQPVCKTALGMALSYIALLLPSIPDPIMSLMNGYQECRPANGDISYDTEESLSADDTFGHSFNVPNKDVGNSGGQNIQTVRQHVRHDVTKELAYR